MADKEIFHFPVIGHRSIGHSRSGHPRKNARCRPRMGSNHGLFEFGKLNGETSAGRPDGGP